MECLYRFGGTPAGYAKVAREAGMANNTVAAGYIEQLTDLLCVAPSLAWDVSLQRPNRRRPCKFQMTNLLAATAWHPAHIRSPADFRSLPEAQQAVLLEWAVAQECWRRAALRGQEMPERMTFWKSDRHELDFVLSANDFLEIKRHHPPRFPDPDGDNYVELPICATGGLTGAGKATTFQFIRLAG